MSVQTLVLDVKQSRENEREGLLSLLPDCRFGVKVRAKTIPAECIGSSHDNLLSQLWPYNGLTFA